MVTLRGNCILNSHGLGQVWTIDNGNKIRFYTFVLGLLMQDIMLVNLHVRFIIRKIVWDKLIAAIFLYLFRSRIAKNNFRNIFQNIL